MRTKLKRETCQPGSKEPTLISMTFGLGKNVATQKLNDGSIAKEASIKVLHCKGR